MGVEDIYSKRQRRLRGEEPDLFRYDWLPAPLRVQVTHIWDDVLGSIRDLGEDPFVDHNHRRVVDVLQREYGVRKLPGAERVGENAPFFELRQFLLDTQSVEQALDAIELSFRSRPRPNSKHPACLREFARIDRLPNAIVELNHRFLEHSVGYSLEQGVIVRVDSTMLHSEVVKPSLLILQDVRYAGAQDEFLRAHEHYRHGRSKEALADCLKSLESMLKAICAKRRWTHSPKATAQPLIELVFTQGLVPSFWSQHFSSLRSCMESGVPTGRNNLAGHGQGATVLEVPEHVVAYVLHQTGAAIVFLDRAERSLPPVN